MKRTHYLLALPAALTLVGGIVAGCGSGGKTVSVSGRAQSKTGRIVMAIKWPAPKTRVIPTATTTLRIQIVSLGGIFTDTGSNTKIVEVGPGTPTVTISNVPAGPVVIQVFAIFKASNGSEVVLAELGTPMTVDIGANQENDITFSLGASITVDNTVIATTLQEVIDANGNPVDPASPAGTPVILNENTPYVVVDKAVYAITSTAAPGQPAPFGAAPLTSRAAAPTPTPTPVATPFPFPSATAFLYTVVNNQTDSFLTITDRNGMPVTPSSASQTGDPLFVKVDASNAVNGFDSGKVQPTLASAYSPDGSVTASFTLQVGTPPK